jgi:hypothetical protein
VREKIIHGSDWPILPVPPMFSIGVGATAKLFCEMNWVTRDYQIKKRLGFDDAYWNRAAQVLRISGAPAKDPGLREHAQTPA